MAKKKDFSIKENMHLGERQPCGDVGKLCHLSQSNSKVLNIIVIKN
jgi:hypothetical protein